MPTRPTNRKNSPNRRQKTMSAVRVMATMISAAAGVRPEALPPTRAASGDRRHVVVERDRGAVAGRHDADETPATVVAVEAPDLATTSRGGGRRAWRIDRDGAHVEHRQARLEPVLPPVPEHERVAARRAGDRVPPLGRGAYAADVAAQRRPVPRCDLGERERILAPMPGEQAAAGALAGRSLVLDGHEDRAVGGHVEMPDPLAMVGRRVGAEEAARFDLDVVERGTHRIQIELLARTGRVGADAAN